MTSESGETMFLLSQRTATEETATMTTRPGMTKRYKNGELSLAEVHALGVGARSRYFDKLREMSRNATIGGVRWLGDRLEALTVPCHGEAHSNPHIDHCMDCLNVKWGRMLKPLPSCTHEGSITSDFGDRVCCACGDTVGNTTDRVYL